MIFHLIFWGKYALAKLGVSSDDGQGLTEYAIIIMLIAIAVITTLTLFGQGLNDLFQSVVGNFESL